MKKLLKQFLSSTASRPSGKGILNGQRLCLFAPILDSSYASAMPIQISSPANNLPGTGETVEN
jgi:hypothetical protein